jgi:hypothetical protein
MHHKGVQLDIGVPKSEALSDPIISENGHRTLI